MMQIFINELSLEGQFFSGEDFTQAVKVFVAIFSLINDKVREKQIYKDALFINRNAIRDEQFQASFNRIRDMTLQIAFRDIIFNKLNPKDWRQEQIHSVEDDYFCITGDDSEPVTNTTLAEATERVLQNDDLLCLLINFVDSRFTDCERLTVIKNYDEDNPVDLDCVEEKSSLENWLENELALSRIEYDYHSNTGPMDSQTILRDTARFQRTSFVHQGRRVHKEIKTGYFWYVDNLHVGHDAHLEVFDPQGTHIGEANLEGIIDISKADNSKKLRIN